MYFVIAIIVFVGIIVASGIWVLDKNTIAPTSPYERDEEDWVKTKLAIGIIALVAAGLWPIALAGLAFVLVVLILLKIVGFLLAVGNRFKKE